MTQTMTHSMQHLEDHARKATVQAEVLAGICSHPAKRLEMRMVRSMEGSELTIVCQECGGSFGSDSTVYAGLFAECLKHGKRLDDEQIYTQAEIIQRGMAE
jgi:hypothetical protein